MKKYTSFLILCTICFLFIMSLLLSRWIALTIGLIILGSFGYLEKIFNIEITRRIRITLLISFIILSAGNIFYSYYKESTMNQKVQQVNDDAKKAKKQVIDLVTKEKELRGKLSEAENAAKTAKEQINDLSEYGEVSTYTFYGYQQSGLWLSPFTPVSKWTEGYLTVTNNAYYFKRTPDAIRHYKDLIKRCPKFPFPYLALSQSLQNNGDPSWKQYAIKAQSIMSKTTKIPLHSKDHDGWLEQVNKILDPNQMNSVIIRGNIHKSGQ